MNMKVIVAVVAVACLLALPWPAHSNSNVDVVKAKATVVGPTLTDAFILHARYAAIPKCFKGVPLASVVGDCRPSLCGGTQAAGTKIRGTLANPLRQFTYSGLFAISPDGTTAIFSIQGTEGEQDIFYDVSLVPDFGVREFFPKAPFGSAVPIGFWKLFKAGLPSVQTYINNMRRDYPAVTEVTFVGHSLGGILTSFNAAYFGHILAQRGYPLITYSFAPARHANDDFTKWLAGQTAVADGAYYRIISKFDIVPNLVPPVPFKHVGTEYFIDSDTLGGTSPIYRCPSPSPGVENPACLNGENLLLVSLEPGHTSYLGTDWQTICA